MRKLLDGLYGATAAIAAVFMVGLLVMVLLSILGRQLGFHVPGTDAYAGYMMAGCGFLALAHTLKRGEHIRVTLFLHHLKGSARRALELWALGTGTLLSLLFAIYSVKLAWQSRVFNDISTSTDATPLWIPQLGMALGAVVMTIACLDEWVLEWRGLRKGESNGEALRNE
jgi:TRAP-type C4-dicarboxylate transport system permease small subunit